MKGIVKGFDNLPRLVKIIFALPGLDILWSIYRLCKSIAKKSFLGVILAIVLLVVGPAIFWVVDLITIIISGKVIWF